MSDPTEAVFVPGAVAQLNPDGIRANYFQNIQPGGVVVSSALSNGNGQWTRSTDPIETPERFRTTNDDSTKEALQEDQPPLPDIDGGVTNSTPESPFETYHRFPFSTGDRPVDLVDMKYTTNGIGYPRDDIRLKVNTWGGKHNVLGPWQTWDSIPPLKNVPSNQSEVLKLKNAVRLEL